MAPDFSFFSYCLCLIALVVYSTRYEVLQTYGLPLPCYSHPPYGTNRWQYMSDHVLLPRQDGIPHMACVLSDTNCVEPSQPQVTVGEMEAILALLTHQFACEACIDHSIKPVSLDPCADFSTSLVILTLVTKILTVLRFR